MALTDPTATHQPPQPQAPDVQDPTAGFDGVKGLIDELGQAVKANAEKSSGTMDAAEAKDYAQAGLFAAQALAALVPYPNPGAPNAPGDNPAKVND